MTRCTIFTFLLTAGMLAFTGVPGHSQTTGQGQTGTSQMLPLGGNNAIVGLGESDPITKRIQSTQYRLTPGDNYTLVITIGAIVTYPLILQENYELDVPYVGTINVKGMYFSDLRKLISDRLKKLLPLAQFVTVIFQSPALFDVEVYGWVKNPGIVTVNPLSQVSDAIEIAKGIRDGGSTRRISLTRGGEESSVDLVRYGRGEGKENDPYLEPGDRIFVPEAAITATVEGQVASPGVYELVPGDTLASLLSMAGGVRPEAAGQAIEIQRFNPDGSTSRLTIDLSKEPVAEVASGDRVRVPIMTENKPTVLVTGAVYGAPVPTDKPAVVPTGPVAVNIPFVAGLTLLDALGAMGGPTPLAQASQSSIMHATGQRVLVDVETLWATKNPALDVVLQAGDTVTIPIVDGVLVLGQVRNPGKVSYSPGLTVGDYLSAAGGINDATGTPNGVYFIDAKNARTKANLGDRVKPGTMIFADTNVWGYTLQAIAIVGTVATATTAIVTVAGFIQYAPAFINAIKALFPAPTQ